MPARWLIIGKRSPPKSSITGFNDFNPMLVETIPFKGKKKKVGVTQIHKHLLYPRKKTSENGKRNDYSILEKIKNLL